jgi:hypothetical protein
MTRISGKMLDDDVIKRNALMHTITPNERLKPVDKNALLSSILKFFLPGNWRIMRSTHIMDAVTC